MLKIKLALKMKALIQKRCRFTTKLELDFSSNLKKPQYKYY